MAKVEKTQISVQVLKSVEEKQDAIVLTLTLLEARVLRTILGQTIMPTSNNNNTASSIGFEIFYGLLDSNCQSFTPSLVFSGGMVLNPNDDLSNPLVFSR